MTMNDANKKPNMSKTSAALLGVYAGYGLYCAATEKEVIDQVPLKSNSPKVVVIGAGFSGIAVSVRLYEKGIDHVILEKEQEVGGTW